MVRSLVAGACLAFASVPLLAQSEDFGKWIVLFNGKDLTGWTNAKPKFQPRRKPGENRWKVENGTLTNVAGGAEGNDICTTREFDDYELILEYKIPKGGNSGVYLRGQIEVQIFDSYGKKDEELRPVDAGAIYGGNFVALKNAQKPPGEWNEYRILHIGHRITVWHNGVLIQDNIYQPKATPGAMRETPDGRKLDTRRGPLMLQGDHTRVWYRNIRIRPLFKDPGWRPLWNGKDLSEFTARGRKEMRWEVRDHAITNTHCGGQGHDIWTKESFGNFLLHYAYKPDTHPENCNDRSGNSGFYLRDQWEIQILAHQSTKNPHTDGSLYSIKPPSVLASHGPDHWNHMDVKLVGRKIWVWQNGKLIHDGVVCDTRTDNHSVKTLEFTKAPFKLQGDHGKVWFTSLYIRPLPDDLEE